MLRLPTRSNRTPAPAAALIAVGCRSHDIEAPPPRASPASAFFFQVSEEGLLPGGEAER